MKIETERLIFREWTMQDVEALANGLKDFDVAKNLTVPFPYKRSDAIEFISKHKNSSEKENYFAITLKDSGEVIGGTNINILDGERQNRGGIWLGKKFWGKGYGSEAWAARAKFGFEVLKQDKLFNGFFDFNNASKHMQLKVGYKIVGSKKNYCPALQSEVDEILTTLDKADFYENPYSKNYVIFKD